MSTPRIEPELLLDNQLCFKLYAASRAVIRGYRPLLESLGLTYPQYLVMLVLWEWHARPPELPSVKALGERLQLDSGTLTPLLKRLEHLGLVRRQRAAHDEREVHLALTEAGAALREEVIPLRNELICRSGLDLNEMGELRARLAELLGQITGLPG
ncbi:MarR family winged helix-turn-helix transcriptional regulator [Metapseudomonas furukawaii]|jgi:DNA-binding MarR family transcriptional regulator|uniref:Organic hydroperoxide resistance transcriptional regulator n=1 Tax=Metapseudomonas furukawaii TaxID=1149133 RepID=A0AAD1BZC3_METFU|nr:MarR family transcriptional regulator [Pseudomonas furukawaii]ELS24093.1 Organic hydroperoxide resistance transcriptional regulator [Pseudomonas furukawaii]WAG81266.1 MarR family transcriptional regulator [Pseudomonas furukawaii]BAU74048.1 organic hydroperoxide resistance transcriptional regulator [Pseudomonas furukawaii]